MMRRFLCGLFIVCLLLSSAGCSFINLDAENQLRSPHAAGEQDAIQTALEHHIHSLQSQDDTKEPSPGYVLKYPKMGEYRSAFIMKDMNGDGKEDALAFYALRLEGANTHIALLSKKGDAWTCVDDIEGLATEIERVTFGDLNGDTIPELFAGFSMFNTRDRRLMLYMWEKDHFVERYSDTYTSMIVGSMVKKGVDDLLLFRLNAAEESSTVRLLSMEKDAVVEKGAASIDGYIQQFGDYAFANLPNGARGLYQDCLKDVQTTITEVIVWDGEQLTVPLYDPTENITTHSARESGLPSMDIDKDGRIEWPQSFRMPGDELAEAKDVQLWLSDWYSWSQAYNKPVKKLTNIVNTTDRYYLTIPEEWEGRITARYAESQRCLSVMELKDGTVGNELFRVVTIQQGEDNPFGDDGYAFLNSNDKLRYVVKYDKSSDFDLTMDYLSSLFVVCNIQ